MCVEEVKECMGGEGDKRNEKKLGENERICKKNNWGKW